MLAAETSPVFMLRLPSLSVKMFPKYESRTNEGPGKVGGGILYIVIYCNIKYILHIIVCFIFLFNM